MTREKATVSRPAPAALCGLLAAGAGLAAAEVVGLALRPEATPLLAVGATVVDLVPRPVKEVAVATFGAADKPLLLGGMALVLAGLAALVGVGARRRRWVAPAGAALLAAVGTVAALTRPTAGPLDALPSLTAGAVAVGVLRLLLAHAPPHLVGEDTPTSGDASTGEPDTADDAAPVPERVDSGPGRRRFVVLAGSTAAVSALGGLGARWMAPAGVSGGSQPAAVRLPRPASPAAPVPDGAELDVDGLGAFFTPNDTFYRVDTALSVPRIDAGAWRLRVHGRGTKEREYTLGDLLKRSDLVERDITLACVSNPVGGSYVGNARWIGVPLATLLTEAGVRPPAEGGPADQLVSRSEDGMTIGTPVADVMDGRDALLAVGMNGRPLAPEHGSPVRMVVPGLYGYVSACKWLVELELTTFDAYDPYWVPRGWSAKAPVKTQSRIDTPKDGDNISAGTVAVAGVAWAQHRGVDTVEVRVDGGDWREARLADEDSADTWRQWVLDWDAEPGEHGLTVRATDRDGRTQTAKSAPPAPDGATGHHSVTVTVD